MICYNRSPNAYLGVAGASDWGGELNLLQKQGAYSDAAQGNRRTAKITHPQRVKNAGPGEGQTKMLGTSFWHKWLRPI